MGAIQLQPARHGDTGPVGPASCEDVGSTQMSVREAGHIREREPGAQHPAAERGRDVGERGHVEFGLGLPGARADFAWTGSARARPFGARPFGAGAVCARAI